MSFDSFKSTVPGASELRLLSKVTLDKKGDKHTVQLKQKGAGDGILVNLNWKTSADLDLGCFYELGSQQSGGGFFSKLAGGGGAQKSVIDGLQFSNAGGPRERVTRQGCYIQKPWIWHQGDDRTGAQSASGEFIHINPKGYADIKRVDIYAMIYEGVARWDQTDAVVTLTVPGSPDIIVEMGTQRNTSPFCVIASLDFVGGDQIRVTKRATFHTGHDTADRAYNWGMRWQEGGGK